MVVLTLLPALTRVNRMRRAVTEAAESVSDAVRSLSWVARGSLSIVLGALWLADGALPGRRGAGDALSYAGPGEVAAARIVRVTATGMNPKR